MRLADYGHHACSCAATVCQHQLVPSHIRQHKLSTTKPGKPGGFPVLMTSPCAGTAVQQPPALKVFGRQQRSIAMASATSPLSNQELPLVQHLGPNARPSILSQGLASLEQPASNPLFRDGSGGDMPPKAKASKSARDLRAIIKGGLQVGNMLSNAALMMLRCLARWHAHAMHRAKVVCPVCIPDCD